MTKRAIVVASILWVSYASPAQAQGASFHLGIYGGLGVSSAFRGGDGAEVDPEPKFSWNPGVRFAYFGQQGLSLLSVIDVGYARMGYTSYSPVLDVVTTHEREHVQIDLMAGIKWEYLYAMGGLYIAPAVGSWWWNDYDVRRTDSDYGTDFGAIVELGGLINLTHDFTLITGAGVRFGVLDVHDGFEPSVYNWAFQGVLGLTYGLF